MVSCSYAFLSRIFLDKSKTHHGASVNDRLSQNNIHLFQDGKAAEAGQPGPFVQENNSHNSLPVQYAVDDIEAAACVTTGQPPFSVFSKRQKQYIVFLTAWASLFSAISANIYFPVLNTLAIDLKVSNELINLTLTSYMIFQGLAPTIYGDLADMAGRRPAYIIGFIIYIGANLGLALQNSYAALFILRCLQSSGSSGTIAMGNGVVADIASSSERGIYMGKRTVPMKRTA